LSSPSACLHCCPMVKWRQEDLPLDRRDSAKHLLPAGLAPLREESDDEAFSVPEPEREPSCQPILLPDASFDLRSLRDTGPASGIAMGDSVCRSRSSGSHAPETPPLPPRRWMKPFGGAHVTGNSIFKGGALPDLLDCGVEPKHSDGERPVSPASSSCRLRPGNASVQMEFEDAGGTLKSSTEAFGPHLEVTVDVDDEKDDPDAVCEPETNPGGTPWVVFRVVTILLVSLWISGAAGSFLSLDHAPGRVVRVEDVDVLTAANASLGVGAGRVSLLQGGEAVHVVWPRPYQFVPHALSCDGSGAHLSISDDFNVYAGPMQKARPVTFQPVAPCTALEGRVVKDLSVACFEGSASPMPMCRGLVLPAEGQRLVDCPLFMPKPPEPESAGDGDTAGDAGAGAATTPPPKTWEIGDEWLEDDNVESVAVNAECFESDSDGGVTDAFAPYRSGCVIVGTRSGRVVQLRMQISGANRLVPVWAMQRRGSPVGPGSLHVLAGGMVLALQQHLGILQALDPAQGNVVGEWRLPLQSTVSWVSLCGGGGTLYLLGNGGEQGAILWRFPMPFEIAGAALGRTDHSQSHAGS